jgi:hypothetical protein
MKTVARPLPLRQMITLRSLGNVFGPIAILDAQGLCNSKLNTHTHAGRMPILPLRIRQLFLIQQLL